MSSPFLYPRGHNSCVEYCKAFPIPVDFRYIISPVDVLTQSQKFFRIRFLHGFLRSSPDFVWDRINFLPISWYSTVFWN